MTWTCKECGGTSVQHLRLCWVDCNEDSAEPEIQYDSKPELFYPCSTWCVDCEDHTKQVFNISEGTKA